MDFIKDVYEAGVVGAGGAGFPTYKKLDAKAEFLIVNGAECEPLIETDKFIMRNNAERVVRGAKMSGHHLQAKFIYIALKQKYSTEANILQNEIKKQNAPIQLFFMDSFYPAGDEHVMAYHVSDRIVPPGSVPIRAGIVVSNVGTMANVANAVEGIGVSTKLLSVLGEVKKPCIIDVPVGTSLKSCIESAGGVIHPNTAFIIGGPMMGQYINFDDIGNHFVTKTTGAIIAVPPDLGAVKRKNMDLAKIINRAKSVCIQCSYCTDMCPRYLLGHNLRPHKIMRTLAYQGLDKAALQADCKGALICSECGVCEEYACPMGLSPRRVNVAMKSKLRELGIQYEVSNSTTQARAENNIRKVPSDRLIRRLGLGGYYVHLNDDIIGPEITEICVHLKQHIGQPAVPIVKVGEQVRAGQKIGEVPFGALGANVHTGIDGIVTKIDESIWIKKEVV